MTLSEVRLDRSALLANLRSLKSLASPGTSICGVVKGNAYGHGLPPIVQCLDGQVDYFQIDDLQELRELRNVTSTPALVLGYIAQGELEEAIELGCEPAVFDQDHLNWWGAAARRLGIPIGIHLKIDALLGRLGILPEQAQSTLDELEKWPELRLESIYAHFANIEDTTDLTHAEAQREVLDSVWKFVRERLPETRGHISATSGLMTLEQEHPRDLVRLGIGLYGMYPSGPLARTHDSLGLSPVLSWTTRLAQVKLLPARHPIGYGLTYVTSRPTRVGIVPQGYSDGYDRGLSNSGEVLVRGQRCPILGRIAMNMFAIDLTGVPDASREDEVVLIGRQGAEKILAEDLAVRLGTINYEITSRISPLLPRRVSYGLGEEIEAVGTL